jgi:UDP-N-acetylmuramoyl-L-alanyl-D-glutamate--2,6-diaminopimelate ligase
MLLSKLAGDLAGDAGALEIEGLTADSREVRPGWLFAALPGTRHDGTTFVPQAIENGAIAVLSASRLDTPVPVLMGEDPRQCLARMAARFYRSQPGNIVAVTGTNGKSSIVWFLRQIWASTGVNAACLGTLGITTRNGHYAGGLTTPDPVALARQVAGLANDGVSHLALEASSHGLDQRRMDGLTLAAAAFTNLSHDHLDYHPDAESYLAAKLRLFTELLPAGSPAIINIDSDAGKTVAERAAAKGLHVVTYGQKAEADIHFEVKRADLAGQVLHLAWPGGDAEVAVPLVGAFQAENAVAAFALALSLGTPAHQCLFALSSLQGAPGRLQPAGNTKARAAFVDYAHTPDALSSAIASIKAHAGGRIVTVFGCGGDRDNAKRPVMGEIAADLSDVAIVTDDNPRTEDAAAIRAQIMAACPGGIEIGDRREAIFHAVSLLQPGDVALIAGKGHESGQIVGQETLPFDDLSVTGQAMEALK